MADAEIKLYYFDFRGRAEVLRMMLAMADKKFEDIRWAPEDWPKWKSESPFGTAPFIDINGKRYGESVALATYLAREFGFYGKTNLDGLRVDEVVQLLIDLQSKLVKAHYTKDQTLKADLDRKLAEEDIPTTYGFFQKLLKENGTGVFVGNEPTLADLIVYDNMYALKTRNNYDAAAKFPELKTMQDKVESNERLRNYLASRKQTPILDLDACLAQPYACKDTEVNVDTYHDSNNADED
nr:hypothetical protein BaRGS_034653 [Batillaria attramentaria]